MRVLVGCEFSGVVRRAFRDLWHDAWSCDILPAEDASCFHLQCDVRDILDQNWDLAIFHPPCTYLANSGARWWAKRQQEQQAALAFVQALLDAPIPRIALENPEGRISTAIRKPDQIIQPWMFGDKATKKTHLWLKGLPILQPTKLEWYRPQNVWRMGQTKDRSKNRSRTYQGIAVAMAQQYSQWIEKGQLYAS